VRDAFDVRIAVASLTRALEYLARADDSSLPQFDRDEAHRNALGLIEHAGRAVDEVTLRPHANLKSTRSR